MRLYLAGPMTGVPLFNFPLFDECAARLRAKGFEVVNPAEEDRRLDGFDPVADHAKPFVHYMRRDLPLVMACDGVAVLPGWQRSKGARLEVHVALECGLALYDALTGEPYQESILQEAQRLVHGDRGAAYSHPLTDYACTAGLWNAIWGPHGADKLRADLTPEDAILGMIAVKMSRESRQGKRDNRTDMAGYAECLDLVHQRRAEARGTASTPSD